MCLKPKPLPPIPQDTRQVAQQIYPPEHLLRRLGEEYAEVLRDEDFADLYPPTGQPALSPALLALVTVLQAIEHCSDRLAAQMVRSRIDWKSVALAPPPSTPCTCRWTMPASIPAFYASSASASSLTKPNGASLMPSSNASKTEASSKDAPSSAPTAWPLWRPYGNLPKSSWSWRRCA
jgi:hypothetical protein